MERRDFIATAALGATGAGGAILATAEPALAAVIASPGAQIVWNPSITSSDRNQYKTWPEVLDAILESDGPHVVYVVGEAHITTGVWDTLGDMPLMFACASHRDWFLGGSRLIIDDGAVLDPPPSFLVADAGLLIVSESSIPLVEQVQPLGGIVAQRGGAFAAVDAPIWYADDTGHNRIVLAGAHYEGRLVNGDLFGFGSEGGEPVAEVSGNDMWLICALGPGLGIVMNDTLKGSANCTLRYMLNTSVASPLIDEIVQTDWAGNVLIDRSSHSSHVAFAGTSGWNTSPNNVNAALAELRDRVAALENP